MRGDLELNELQQLVLEQIIDPENEGLKAVEIAKKLGVILQKVTPTLKFLVKHGVIENDEGRYWVCEGAEVRREGEELVARPKEKQPKEKEKEPTGGGQAESELEEEKEYGNLEEQMSFEGLEGLDKLKREALEEWLKTYTVGPKSRTVIIKQYETNPRVRFTQQGLYETMRNAGVKEDHTVGIVEAVFNLENECAKFLTPIDRDELISRKTTLTGSKTSRKFFEEPLLRRGRERRTATFDTGEEEEEEVGMRTIIRQEIARALKTDGGTHTHKSDLDKETTPAIDVVEEPMLDKKGNPMTDGKGNTVYRRRYVKAEDKRDVELHSLTQKYENLTEQLHTLERDHDNEQLNSQIQYLSGKIDTLEKNPSNLPAETTLEIRRLEKSADALNNFIDKATTLAAAHMGIPAAALESGDYTREKLTDAELQDLHDFMDQKRAEREKEKG